MIGDVSLSDKIISTHYLTQRQTTVDDLYIRETPFQLTTSHRGRQRLTLDEILKLVFQLTTSHRGRLEDVLTELSKYTISTHYLTQRQTGMSGRSGRGNQNFNSLPHTEVDTGTYFTKIIPKTFQLTTSHRGRPSEALLYSLYGTYFNSLPHTEVDLPKRYFTACMELISTHYLTQRQTSQRL